MALVLLVGAGGMGTGIAQLVLTAGHSLHLIDKSENHLSDAHAALQAKLSRERAAGRIAGNPDEMLMRLSTHLDIPEQPYEVLLEAVPERREIKREVLSQLLERAAEGALVATTTLAMPLHWLVGKDDRVLGFHFMNPPAALRLCELVLPASAGRERADAARAFLEGLDLTVVEAPDQPGFVLNRTHVPFLLGAMERVEEGVEAEDVDAVFVLGCKHPMGPLAIADLVGLDVLLSIAETLEHEGGRFQIPSLLREMVARGQLGRKAGRGFFTYDEP